MELEEPTDPVDSDEDRRRGRPTGGAAISCSSTEVTRAVHNVRGLKLKLLPAPEPKSAHLSSLPRVQRRKPHRSNLHVDVCLLQLCLPRRPPIAILTLSFVPPRVGGWARAQSTAQTGFRLQLTGRR
eukprot:COSAG02_NODE_22191_length_760_cov_3.974281_2_plen_127_part_00